MPLSSYAPLETEAPVFDVVVSIPSGVTLERIEGLAKQAGELSPIQIDGLLKALGKGPRVKIGDHISQEKADRAKEQFSRLGLTVKVIPQLSLKIKTENDFDGLFLCRACNSRVALPQNRQCPSCGVFVDKVTDEWLLRREILAQERAKLDSQINREDQEMAKRTRKSLEDALRSKIREELEEEYGIHKNSSLFSGKAGLFRAGGLLALLSLSFIGGQMIPPDLLPWNRFLGTAQAASNSTGLDTEKTLHNVGAKMPPGVDADSGLGAGGIGNPDTDDPMIQALAGGKKMGGPGLTMEQAIAASRTLAATVGNTTYDRATGAGSGVDSEGREGHSVNAVTSVEDEPVSVSPVVKQLLAADFASDLGTLGQWQRARALIKLVKPQAVEPVAIAALQTADLEAQAWSLQSLSESRARQAMDMLIADAMLISDPASRSLALGKVGVIVRNHVQFSPDAARVFLKLAAESLKEISDQNVKKLLMNEWMIFMGRILANESIMYAKAGNLSKAKAAEAQIDIFFKEASDDATRARLHVLKYSIQKGMGNQKNAEQSLLAAMAMTGHVTDVVKRATLMRTLAQLAGSASLVPMQEALASLRSVMDAKTTLHTEQAFGQISLMYADFGLKSQADEYRRLAVSVKSVTPLESGALQADLMVRGDMALAKLLQAGGRYADSEGVLQRISTYFL